MAKASRSLSGVRSDAITLAEDTAELITRIEAVEAHYMAKARAVGRGIEQRRAKSTKTSKETSSLAHQHYGDIKHLIVSMKEAQVYWSQFTEATKHGAKRTELLEKLVKTAPDKNVFTGRAGKIFVMSFLKAWEEVEKLAEAGSEHLFQMDFECSRCGHTFKSLPYVHVKDLVCSSCHFIVLSYY